MNVIFCSLQNTSTSWCLRAVERALKRDREVVPILQSWGDEYPDAKLVYQVKLFTESIIQSEDPKIIYMLFIQVRTCTVLSSLCSFPR